MAACAQSREPVLLKQAQRPHPDLYVTEATIPIRDGRTQLSSIQLLPEAASMLIELDGSRGYYFIDEFYTPSRQELGRSGLFQTREAREVSGLADFLFPNDDTAQPEAGEYEVSFKVFRNRAGTQPLGDGSVELRVYQTLRNLDDSCGLHLDFLVDRNAVGDEFIDAVSQLVPRVSSIFRPVNVGIIDYQVQRIDLSNDNIDLDDDETVLSVVDDVLAQGRRENGARQDAVHILLVETIGRADGMTRLSNVAGYSMGLPGPYDADHPNATVLVGSRLFTRPTADGSIALDTDAMATTLAHEIGHFLGLYHTSERRTPEHDPLMETDQCVEGQMCSQAFGKNVMTSASWVVPGAGNPLTRSVLTPNQGRVLRRHPLCRPYQLEQPKTCDLQCQAPQICALLDAQASCRMACDPSDEVPCGNGRVCEPEDGGFFICQ